MPDLSPLETVCAVVGLYVLVVIAFSLRYRAWETTAYPEDTWSADDAPMPSDPPERLDAHMHRRRN